MKKLSGLFLALGIFAMTNMAYSQSNDNHSVTITVAAINQMAIVGGDVSLTINTASAGSELTSQNDNTTTDLNWTTNEASKKITIVSNLASPNYTLTVEAQNASGGTAAGVISLSTTAIDFVTGISNTVGTCDLSYTASATVASGAGSDIHTVTYTITDV